MGVQKLVDAATQITTKNGVGSTPSGLATAKAIGKLRAAAALLVISSVTMFVIIKRTARMPSLSTSTMRWIPSHVTAQAKASALRP